MRIAIVTSRGCKYPSLKSPQYLDQDNCFRGLSTEGEVFLIGNIVGSRPYAISQLSFSTMLNKLPLAWNNRYATFFSIIPPVEGLRDRLDLFSDALYTRACFEYLSTNKVDAIYSFPWPFDRYVVAWARRLSIPLIIEMWEDYACFASLVMTSLGLPQLVVAREVKRTYHWMCDVANRADSVIVPTRVFADRLQELGVKGGKIRVIPVGVDSSPSLDLQCTKEKHNLKDDERVVFHIGALSPWHDLHTLMGSIQYVKSKLVFIIAGGRDRDLEQQAEYYAQGGTRVIFTGRLEPSEVGSYLSLADICVAPYRFPQPSGFFPAKVIRYMLAGKAIVATDTPEIREMFKNREAGILVPQGNTRALAQALDRLAEDGRERLRLGSLAREIAENNYLIKHHTERLTKVFRKVI